MSFAIFSSFATCALICWRTNAEMTTATSSATNTSAAPFSNAVEPTRTSRCIAADFFGMITYTGKLSISLRFQ